MKNPEKCPKCNKPWKIGQAGLYCCCGRICPYCGFAEGHPNDYNPEKWRKEQEEIDKIIGIPARIFLSEEYLRGKKNENRTKNNE